MDIDECAINTHNCHINAFCNNTEGSHNCTCLPGLSGDGSNCTGNYMLLKSVFTHVTIIYVILLKQRKAST